MVANAENVRVAVTGAIYKAPLGTAAPTTSSSALDAAFEDMGYVSEDGITESWDDSVDNIVAWQNAVTVRSATTESTGSLEFKLIETKAVVLEAYYRGSTVTDEGGGEFKMEVKPLTSDRSAWVLDTLDGDKVTRHYVGNGEIVERGEVMYQNGEPIGYECTLRVYPDSDGNLMVKLSNDPAWAPS